MARILVVEDSRTQAMMIRRKLEEAHYEVEVAYQGQLAMDSIRKRPPDLVLTDLEMPVMNGLELVEAIRHEFSWVPVILMTAHGSEEIASLALRRGAASYVPKAYLDEDILPTLERILDLTRIDRHLHQAVDSLTNTELYFVLHNDAALISPILGYLDDLLNKLKLCDATERMRMCVALQEALLNAICHGNLEVESDVRQQGDSAYQDLIQARRAQTPYQARRVFFHVRISPTEASYTVRDEGRGFDPSKLPDPTNPANLERVGGRGLLLIRTFMDQVSHNPRGNEINMVKRRNEPK